jgi:hypothetical protein
LELGEDYYCVFGVAFGEGIWWLEMDGEETGKGAERIVATKVVRRKKERLLLRLSENILIVDWRCSMK